MSYDKDVWVQGDVDTTWDALIDTLTFHNYRLTKVVPKSQLTAKRGSRLVSGFAGSTTNSHRTIVVAVRPDGDRTAVKFSVWFSGLAVGISWRGARQEIDNMVREFEAEVSKRYGPQVVTESVAARTQPSISCPSCQKDVQADFVVCPYCAAQLQQPNPVCSNCGKNIEPDFQLCPYCSTPR